MTDRQQDPWADMPRWAEGEAYGGAPGEGPAGAPDDSVPGWSAPGSDPEPAPAPPSAMEPAMCSWCATPAPDGATNCATCGAALARRESIGDLVIPGLTAVDPALQDLADRPLHLTGPSPSHGVASGVVVAAAAGGPIGLAILGGVGAVAAVEYLGASRGTPGVAGNGEVGEASGAVLQAIERLDRGEALPSTDETTPRPELEHQQGAQAGASGAQSPDSEAGTEETSNGPR